MCPDLDGEQEQDEVFDPVPECRSSVNATLVVSEQCAAGKVLQEELANQKAYLKQSAKHSKKISQHSTPSKSM